MMLNRRKILRLVLPVMLCMAAASAQEEWSGDGEWSDAEEWSDTGPEGAARLFQFAGKLHPMIVHIPIALTLAAGLAEVLVWLTRNHHFQNVARFNVIVAALGGMAATLAGIAAGMSTEYPESFLHSFSMHRSLAVGVTVALVLAAVMSEIHHRTGKSLFRTSYRIILMHCVALMSLCGWFGGHLVYGLEHYKW